jgi:hypothetical protein
MENGYEDHNEFFRGHTPFERIAEYETEIGIELPGFMEIAIFLHPEPMPPNGQIIAAVGAYSIFRVQIPFLFNLDLDLEYPTILYKILKR